MRRLFVARRTCRDSIRYRFADAIPLLRVNPNRYRRALAHRADYASRLRRGSAGLAREDVAAVRQGDLTAIDQVRTISGKGTADRHLVANFHRVTVPPSADESPGPTGFAAPIHDCAIGICYVNEEVYVWVFPIHTRNHSFEGDRFGKIKLRGKGVMR